MTIIYRLPLPSDISKDVISVDDAKGLKLGSDAAAASLTQIKKYTPSINPASVAADTSVEQTFSVPGLKVATDHVLVCEKPTVSAGLDIGNVRVSADDTLAITFQNSTAAPIDAAAETYTLFVATFQ